jgi:Flp pilus assembly protein TadG
MRSKRGGRIATFLHGSADFGATACPRRGAATVEFALAAPILVFMVIGMIELSRGFMARETLSDAARKACRVGIQPGNGNSAITGEVNNILNDNGISAGSATVTVLVNGNAVDASTANTGDQISVKVSVPVSAVFWGGTIFLPSSAIESETIVMMRQG